MRRLPHLVLLPCALAFAPGAVRAVDVEGTVSFQGDVVFQSAIPGLALGDVRVEAASATDATGPGVRCSVLGTTADTADTDGHYPDAGAVTVHLRMERGGPQLPDGACLVTLRASGYDGVATTAHGSTTLLVGPDAIGTNATLSPEPIPLRASKALASLSSECGKWAKKRLKLRSKCNATILKLGGAASVEKCKDAGPEPADCDPGGQVDAVLALAHGANDQQTDVPSGQAVDLGALSAQARCQKLFGKAALQFATALAARIQSQCVKPGADSETCRDQQANAVRTKLDPIDDCKAGVVADGATGREVPDVGPPCDACIDPSGAIDHQCLKSCFAAGLSELAGNLVGDVPVCGDGVPQNGEFCDDGNLVDGDCCSSTCGVNVPDPDQQTCGVGACQVTVALCTEGEPVTCQPGAPGVESLLDPASCTNGVDDDCDGMTDAADPDCMP